jgi:hypothetical protein
MPSRSPFVGGHFDAHAQARERRTQVVRDAGQDQRPILVDLRQVGAHLVEGGGHGRQFGRAAFVEARRRLAGADFLRGLLQGLERTGDAEHDQPGAEQRQQQRGDAPARASPAGISDRCVRAAGPASNRRRRCRRCGS